MAFFRKRNGVWRAEVVRNGIRRSATRETKDAAQSWAAGVEAELVAVRRGEMPRKTVLQALERYKAEVSPKKRGKRWELLLLDAYGREPWAQLWLTDLRPDRIAAWRALAGATNSRPCTTCTVGGSGLCARCSGRESQ